MAMSRSHADLCNHGATYECFWRQPAGFALLGSAAYLAAKRNGPDVLADERLPFGALAEADLQPTKRCPPSLIRRSPDRVGVRFPRPGATLFLATSLPITTQIREKAMAESIYKVIEIVGTSTESWEKAAKAAVDRAAKTLKDLRVAEVKELNLQLNNGKVEAYGAGLKVSFKYRDKD